jgi:hypothetical protein
MLGQETPVDRVLNRLDDYRQVHENEWRARCPAHNGQSDNSLSIRQGEDSRALLHCHAGCDLFEILDALGLGPVDLFIDNGRPGGRMKSANRTTNSKTKGKARTLSTDELPEGTYYEFSGLGGEVRYIQRHKREYYLKVGEDTWKAGLDKEPKLLYGLPELLEAIKQGKTVYHLEGCKDVESARERLGVVAVTSGGTTSWLSRFAGLYTGADVVIIPDNDIKGREYAHEVATDVHPVAASVKLVELPGLEEAQDLTDWLAQAHTKEEFFALADAAPLWHPGAEPPWPEPRELEITLPPVYPLDEDMLPEPVRDWILDTAKRMDNAPPDFAAAACIVVCGSLLGRKVSIRPKKHDDWSCVPNVWGGLVGLPASLKTPTLKQVLRPLEKLAAQARERYEGALEDHEIDEQMVKAHYDALKKKLHDTAKKVVSASASRSDMESVRDEMAAVEKPEEPTARRFTTNDTSIEKMAELLQENPEGLLLVRDELVGWLKSLDKAGHEPARAFYLESWNGDVSHEVDRIGRGSRFVKALCVSVLGGIQPGPLSTYVEGALEEGESADGLLQRLQVLVYPDRGEYETTDLEPDLEARQKAYDVFEGLADLDVEDFMHKKVLEDEELPYVHFDDKGQQVFDSWRSAFEHEVITGAYPAALESHFMKYRSLFASLALIFEAIDFVSGLEGSGVAVSGVNATRAYAWVQYLKEHAIRVYSPMMDTAERRAEALLDHLYQGDVPDGTKTRDIWRKHWSRLTNAREVSEALEILEELGWVRREMKKPDGRGRPSEVVRIHPELRE